MDNIIHLTDSAPLQSADPKTRAASAVTVDPSVKPGMVVGNRTVVGAVSVSNGSRSTDLDRTGIPVCRQVGDGVMAEQVGAFVAGKEVRSAATTVAPSAPHAPASAPQAATPVAFVATAFGKIPLPVTVAVIGEGLLHLGYPIDQVAKLTVPDAGPEQPLELWVNDQQLLCISGGWVCDFNGLRLHTFLLLP